MRMLLISDVHANICALEAIEKSVPAKFLEMNKKAFILGREAYCFLREGRKAQLTRVNACVDRSVASAELASVMTEIKEGLTHAKLLSA